MNVKLTIPERLKDLRVNDKRLTLEQLAEQTGLSRSALGQYEADDYKEISVTAITTLAKFYDVSTDYLLGLSENKKHSDADIQSLHLSDDMITLLRSGKINNRLLCEICTHPHFPRFLVDVEIIIDRIADMRIQHMNLALDIMRKKIISKYSPDENDLHLRTLEVAQVQESEYFGYIVHDDIDAIIADIQEKHLTDAMTADAKPTLEQFDRDMTEALNNENRAESMALAFCKKLNIPSSELSTEELSTFVNIIRKSRDFRMAGSMRGRGVPFQPHGTGNRRKHRK